MRFISYFDLLYEIVIIGAVRDAIFVTEIAKRIIRIFDYLWMTKYIQNCIHRAPVPVVGYFTTVIAFARQIRNSLKRYFVKLVDVYLKLIESIINYLSVAVNKRRSITHLELLYGNVIIGFVEFVGHVPTDRPEFFPFLYDGVEKRNAVQQFGEYLFFARAPFEKIVIFYGMRLVTSKHIGL